MIIVTITETAQSEQRVAISPNTCKTLTSLGHRVILEQNCGLRSGYSNESYLNNGAEILDAAEKVLENADIILVVQKFKASLLEQVKAEATIIGLLTVDNDPNWLKLAQSKNLSLISMEHVARDSKSQTIDALSSQANLAGYRAVIEASYYHNKAFPMMMTAAGTITPAKILILGVGVAGLQAIATARRLGGVVSAYDVRSSTKEQVESLGAKFISFNSDNNLETKSGYAAEATKDHQIQQLTFIGNLIKKFDIIITTAQIPGKPAPRLIDKSMISQMKPFSVIVDMSTGSGGNVEGSEIDKITEIDTIKIVGWSNLAARIPTDASQSYAKNLMNVLNVLICDNQLNFQNEMIIPMMILTRGIVEEKFKNLMTN